MVSDKYINNKKEEMVSSVSAPFLSDLLVPSPCRSHPKGDPNLHRRVTTKGQRTTQPQQFLTRDFLGAGLVGRARLGHSLNPAGNAQRYSEGEPIKSGKEPMKT